MEVLIQKRFFLFVHSTVQRQGVLVMEYKLDIKENALDSFNEALAKEGANKRGNSSRLTQSFHFFSLSRSF
ncbi:hypothetical protein ACK3Z7_08970, partial [Aeromonas caviae]